MATTDTRLATFGGRDEIKELVTGALVRKSRIFVIRRKQPLRKPDGYCKIINPNPLKKGRSRRLNVLSRQPKTASIKNIGRNRTQCGKKLRISEE